MLDVDAGKGRQVIKCIRAAQLQYSSGPECSASVLPTLHYNGCRAHGVCALESSSSYIGLLHVKKKQLTPTVIITVYVEIY